MRRLPNRVRGPERHTLRLPRGRWDRVSRSLTLWLVLLWLMVFGSLTWIHLISGILVAVGVQIAFPLPHSARHGEVHPVAFVRLVARFGWDTVRAGVQVSWIVLRGRPVRNAIVRVNLRSADPVHMTIVAGMTSLVPGTVVVRLDRLAGTLYLHVLDIDGQGGPEAVRAAALAQEDRVLRAVVPVGGPGSPRVLGGSPRAAASAPGDESPSRRHASGEVWQ